MSEQVQKTWDEFFRRWILDLQREAREIDVISTKVFIRLHARSSK